MTSLAETGSSDIALTCFKLHIDHPSEVPVQTLYGMRCGSISTGGRFGGVNGGTYVAGTLAGTHNPNWSKIGSKKSNYIQNSSLEHFDNLYL